MLAVPGSVRIFVCRAATDMRKSFDGLAALVLEHFQEDPLSGDLFVFRNRRGDRLKLLFWDRDGLCQFYKRLEEGTFYLPVAEGADGDAAAPQTITSAELAMLLGGLDFANAKRQRRYRRPNNSPE